MFHWKSFQGYVGYNLISSSKNSVPHPPTIVENILPVMLALESDCYPHRKQIPHRNWLETTTYSQLETPENGQFCFPESEAFCMKFWIPSNFSALDIFFSHYTRVLSSHVYFSNISIISSLATDACALQATSLNWNVAVLQQNKFFKSKTTLFLSLGFAKNESDLFSAWYRGRAISNKALLLVANNYDSVNSELRRVFEREM